jgi:hypothetical protein
MTKETQTKYTVFLNRDGEAYSFLISGQCGTKEDDLQALIDGAVAADLDVVAWAPGVPECYGGDKSTEALRADSIAAGRTIELVDGKYVARGVAAEEQPAKSLGALIREQQQGKASEPIGDDYDEGDEGWDSIAPNPYEPKRAPLDWNKSKPFNNFPGYSVKCDTGPQIEADKHPLCLSPDMADSSHHQVPAIFGSAALLK